MDSHMYISDFTKLLLQQAGTQRQYSLVSIDLISKVLSVMSFPICIQNGFALAIPNLLDEVYMGIEGSGYHLQGIIKTDVDLKVVIDVIFNAMLECFFNISITGGLFLASLKNEYRLRENVKCNSVANYLQEVPVKHNISLHMSTFLCYIEKQCRNQGRESALLQKLNLQFYIQSTHETHAVEHAVQMSTNLNMVGASLLSQSPYLQPTPTIPLLKSPASHNMDSRTNTIAYTDTRPKISTVEHEINIFGWRQISKPPYPPDSNSLDHTKFNINSNNKQSNYPSMNRNDCSNSKHNPNQRPGKDRKEDHHENMNDVNITDISVLALLANLRKHGMDMVFPPLLHDQVLCVIWSISTNRAVLFTHKIIIDTVMKIRGIILKINLPYGHPHTTATESWDRIQQYWGNITKTKIRGIVALLKHGQILEPIRPYKQAGTQSTTLSTNVHGNDDEIHLPIMLTLKKSLITFTDIRLAHDRYVTEFCNEFNTILNSRICNEYIAWGYPSHRSVRLEDAMHFKRGIEQNVDIRSILGLDVALADSRYNSRAEHHWTSCESHQLPFTVPAAPSSLGCVSSNPLHESLNPSLLHHNNSNKSLHACVPGSEVIGNSNPVNNYAPTTPNTETLSLPLTIEIPLTNSSRERSWNSTHAYISLTRSSHYHKSNHEQWDYGNTPPVHQCPLNYCAMGGHGSQFCNDLSPIEAIDNHNTSNSNDMSVNGKASVYNEHRIDELSYKSTNSNKKVQALLVDDTFQLWSNNTFGSNAANTSSYQQRCKSTASNTETSFSNNTIIESVSTGNSLVSCELSKINSVHSGGPMNESDNSFIQHTYCDFSFLSSPTTSINKSGDQHRGQILGQAPF